jgi:hypothetical protein
MNRNALLMRDPAAAALLGAMPAEGADFGNDWNGGYGGGDGSYTYDPNEWAGVAQSFGEFAGDFGHDPSFGDDFGFMDQAMLQKAAAVAAGAPGLTPQQAQAIAGQFGAAVNPQVAALANQAIASHPAVQYANRMRGHTRNREMLLEPNRDSTTKVERFVFAISDVVAALGTGQAISLRDTPDTNIRPQRITMNTVSPGMFLISQIRVGNVDASVGGDVDAWDFNANGQGQSLDMPTLKTSTKVTVSGTYTGLVPSPLTGTGPYTFTVSFKGPATLTA